MKLDSNTSIMTNDPKCEAGDSDDDAVQVTENRCIKCSCYLLHTVVRRDGDEDERGL
jgi:hypothetical protein